MIKFIVKPKLTMMPNSFNIGISLTASATNPKTVVKEVTRMASPLLIAMARIASSFFSPSPRALLYSASM